MRLIAEHVNIDKSEVATTPGDESFRNRPKSQENSRMGLKQKIGKVAGTIHRIKPVC